MNPTTRTTLWVASVVLLCLVTAMLLGKYAFSTESVVEVEVPVEVVVEKEVVVEVEVEKIVEVFVERPTPEVVPDYDVEVIDDLYLGDVVSFRVDDGDLDKLFDGEIRFDDEDYDTHEELVVVGGKTYVLYSLVDDEELGSEPAIGFVERGAVEYKYVFDDPIEMSDISDDEPLKISFLGKEFQIVRATSNELLLRSGEEFYLNEGSSIDFDGVTVTLAFVSENDRVTVCVDAACETIREFDSEAVGSLDVRVEDILVNNRGGAAVLVVGSDTLVEQEDGDEFLDDNESPWNFYIVSTSGDLEGFTLVYDEERDNVDDNEYPPLYLGDKLSLPFDYLTLEFSDVLEADYVEFRFEFDDFNEELENETDIDNEECGRITTRDEDIEVDGEDVNEVFVCGNGLAYYEDTTGDWYETLVTSVKLVNDDAEYQLAIGGAGRLRFENSDDVLIRLSTVWSEERLGIEEDEAEDDDVLLGNEGYGNEEEDVLTPYGAIIFGTEGNSDRDEFVIALPSDKLELELSVY